MNCKICGKDGIYRCALCGEALCSGHMTMRTICASCIKKAKSNHRVYKLASTKEGETVRELVKRLWGEEEQVAFGKRYNVSQLPTYIAKVENKITGFVSFAEADNDLIIVTLGVLPEYQDSGIGRSLVHKAEIEARRMRKVKLLVSTSNDDLPALAFYQDLGFQIYEVKPNIIADKHGKALSGVCGLPVRDELRLQKTLL